MDVDYRTARVYGVWGGGMSESIVVGTDGSATAKRAVAEAIRFAKALAAEVHVVSAYVARDIRIESSERDGFGVDDGNVDAKLKEGLRPRQAQST